MSTWKLNYIRYTLLYKTIMQSAACDFASKALLYFSGHNWKTGSGHGNEAIINNVFTMASVKALLYQPLATSVLIGSDFYVYRGLGHDV